MLVYGGHQYISLCYCQLRKEQPVPKRETALFIILAFLILIVPACQRGPSDQELVEQGEEVYTVSCSRCHQPDGMGVDPVYPELAGNAFVTVREPHRVVDVIVHGRGGMPGFADNLSREEIAAVVSYIRTAWGNNASIVSPGQVVAPD
jgi:mono/diheme cytochrome c family protein